MFYFKIMTDKRNNRVFQVKVRHYGCHVLLSGIVKAFTEKEMDVR